MSARTCLAVFTAAVLTLGCATAPPGTPGAGVGATYTPVIDLQGINQQRYSNDLDSCRQYAYRIDPNQAAINQGVGQALFSAAFMAAIGGRGRNIDQAASGGMLAGMNRGKGRALGTQERIITNCMAGRGYRTLDAPFVVPSGTNSPYSSQTGATTDLVPALQPTGGSNWSPAGGAAPAFGAAAMPVAPPLGTPVAKSVPDGPSVVQTAAVGVTKSTDGADAWSAERLTAVKACHPAPRATLSAKGPGFESYTVGCANGDVLLVRCEMGNCRVMR